MALEPIFDSLAHPTLTGRWPGREVAADFRTLDAQLEQAGFERACAIGLSGVEGYSHEGFIEACRPYPRLVPIAGFDPQRDASAQALHDLREMGFRGIKIHPRFSGLTRRLDTLAQAVADAGDAGLVVFYCTYMHCRLERYPASDPFYALVDLLRGAPRTRVVLVHGGDVNLLRYAELVRHNDHLLLDLSLTIMKYARSSIDQDLEFLFHHFDRRICVGTDWPEYEPVRVRSRFEYFARGLSSVKRENVARGNLQRFLAGDGSC